MAYVPRDIIPGIEFAYGSLTNDETPLVVGLLGSNAYGLAHADSDMDYHGIHYVKTEKLYGLGVKDLIETTRVDHLPDFSSHEIFKYIRLALGGNPTILETLFLDEYLYISDEFKDLREMRMKFLSTKKVKAAYTGYVLHQAKRLHTRRESGTYGFDPDLKKRTRKHARHCFRLLMQAEALLATGQLVIDVSDAREEIFAAGELAETNEAEFLDFITKRVALVDDIKSVLPDHPDRDAIQDWLIEFRKSH
jgi:predicted nucleotidyltransferase